MKCLTCGHESNTQWNSATKKGCHPCHSKSTQLSAQTITASFVYSNVRSNARIRGIEFTLSKSDVSYLSAQPCHYCGMVGGNKSERTLNYNGLDRLDSSFGYVLGNVVTCCGTCNLAKRLMKPTEFLDWITRVYRYSIDPKNKPGTIDADDVTY